MSQQRPSRFCSHQRRPRRTLLLMIVTFGTFAIGSPGQDSALERISNMIITLGAPDVPILPLPFLYAEDGFTYSISNFESSPPLSPSSRFSWTKTGPNIGTLVRTTAFDRSETFITIGSFSPTFGWSGSYRRGNITGIVTMTPFTLTSQSPLRNASTRVPLAPGGAATMGFVVAGAMPRRVLVRAVGPALGQFGVANPAASPVLTVQRAGVEVGANSGWGGAPEVAAVFSKVGAFALPAGSRDCALVLVLSAGNYSSQVRTDAGGEVLFEVYFVD